MERMKTITEVFDPKPYKKKKAPNSGEPGYVQYSVGSDGYTPTAATEDILPSGCYEIKYNPATSQIFAKPIKDPAGLLLDLPEMKSNEVLNLIEKFWNSEKDYKEGNDFVNGGQVHKAGLLLHGPAGGGKSSALKLASKKLIERNGVIFYGEDPFVLKEWLMNFAQVEPDRKSIVILEDLDSLIASYEEVSYLEILDSAKTIDNVLFIATTNYPEKLDQRIYNRPGRFSHLIKIGLPTATMREAYLKAVLKNYQDVSYIIEHTEEFTIDHLNCLINSVYREKKDLKEEIKRLKSLFVVPKSETLTSTGIGLGNG